MTNQSRFAKLAAIAALLALTVVLHNRVERSYAMQSAPNSNDLAVALIRAGLDAQSLTAAGLSSQQTTEVVNDVKVHMGQNPMALANADTALGSARIEFDRLQRLIQSGTYGEGDLSAFATATTQLNTAQAQRETALTGIRTAGTADLSENTKSLLTKLQQNKDWDATIEFKVIDRTQAEWVQLRDALAHERIAAKYQEEVDSTIAAFLATARAVSAVSTAKSNLVANTTAVANAWSNALTGQ